MEACVVICRAAKPKARKGKILLINAVNEVTRERAQSFLTDEHIEHILKAYQGFKDGAGFTRAVPLDELRSKDCNLSIPLYVSQPTNGQADEYDNGAGPKAALSGWLESAAASRQALADIFPKAKLQPKHQGHSPNGHVANLPLFSRRGWQRLPFGAFAESVNDRVEPADAADEPYVGLEDLYPGSLHIRRWGKGSHVIGTKLRFRQGDVIFGRRRAYQRKLAVAEMNGICSAHAMVVRARPGVVLREFLPFLMMSDRFMNRAVEISVGSLSPTINWSTLKLQEFGLPPLDQQRRIAEILWAADESTEQWLSTLAAAREASNTAATAAFRGVSIGDASDGCPTQRLGDAFKVRTGGTPSRANPAFWGGNVPWIKTGEIKYEDIYDSEEKITQLGYENSAAKLVPKEAVLMALYGQGPTLGRVAQLRVEATVNQACAAIFPDPHFNMRYLYYYLASQYANIRRLARGASQPNINALIVKDFIIPAPPLPEQNAVAEELAKHEQAQTLIAHFIAQHRELLLQLTNSLV